LPARSARCACRMVTSGLIAGTAAEGFAGERTIDAADARIHLVQVVVQIPRSRPNGKCAAPAQ
jgi:hypothetical protein